MYSTKLWIVYNTKKGNRTVPLYVVLDLTPLFDRDRAPQGPPFKLAIQRHCSYNLANFTQRSTFNPDRPPDPLGRYFTEVCAVYCFLCTVLVSCEIVTRKARFYPPNNRHSTPSMSL